MQGTVLLARFLEASGRNLPLAVSQMSPLYIVCNLKHCRHLILTTLYTYISVKKIPTKVIDGTMIVEEYLGTSDGGARSWPYATEREGREEGITVLL